MLALLTLVVTVNYVDRYVLSIMVEPIRKSLALSDTQIGLLTGAGFALLYTTLAIPVARLAERHNRVAILTLAVIVWSLATASCGLAATFGLLFLARAMVGLGEAGAIAPAMSMLSDVYPVRSRGSAMAVFGLGGALGGAIAPLVGGWLEPQIGWRHTFLVIGLAGLPLGLLLWMLVDEPARGHADGLQPGGTRALPFVETARRLMRRRSFSLLIPALSLMALGEYSMILWMPAFFSRTFDLGVEEVGHQIALYQGAPFFVGTILGGVLTDRLSRRDVRWIVWLPMIGALLTAPTVLALFGMQTAPLAFALLILPSFVNGLYIGPCYAVVQNLSAVHSRATATAILTFAVNLIGAGLGPFLLGALSTALTRQFGDQSLRYAFFALVPIYLAAAAVFAAISMFIARDLADAEADSRST
jgi:MFS family permease